MPTMQMDSRLVLFWVALAGVLPAQQTDWVQSPVNGRWYGATYRYMTWAEAETLAVSLGGHLATIRNATERSWIAATFAPYIQVPNPTPLRGLHIGLNDIAVEGQWTWTSAEPASFTAWSPFDPTTTPNNNDDVVSTLGLGNSSAWLWHDHAGNYQMRGLIEVTSLPMESWAWPIRHALELMPHSACSFDVDGDEDIDHVIACSHVNEVTLLRNGGTGAISSYQLFQTPAAWSTACADLNDDTHPDVVVATVAGVYGLYGNGSGLGAPVLLTASQQYSSVAIGQFGGDSRKDLVATASQGMLHLFLGSASGTFTLSAMFGPYSSAGGATVADVDSDGIDDAVLGNRILRGLPGGGLVDIGAMPFNSSDKVTCADLDADGDLDLLVTASSVVQVWHNTGSMNFALAQTIPVSAAPHSPGALDFDGDGDVDVAVPCMDGIHVLRRDSAGTLQAHSVLIVYDTETWVASGNMEWAGVPDVDNNGVRDIACCGITNTFAVHRLVRHSPLVEQADVEWSQVQQQSSPGPQYRAGVAVARRTNDVVLFGGAAGTPVGGTLTFDGLNWSSISSQTDPTLRHNHGMAFDTPRNEVLLFGGMDAGGAALGDTWTLNASGWLQRTPATSPVPRFGHGVVYDAARGEVVLFGGRNSTGYLGDTWTWNGFTWTQRQGSGPSSRSEHAMAYDVRRQRTVCIGGRAVSGMQGDVWEWDGANWHQIPGVSSGPGRVSNAAAGWDPQAQRVVLHGGIREDGLSTRTMSYDGVRWVRLVNEAAGPAPRKDHVLFWVPGMSDVWLYGGESEHRMYRNLWRSQLPPTARFTAIGPGCPGSGGMPYLDPLATPVIGTDFVLRVEGAPSGMPMALGLLGLSNTHWGWIQLPTSLGFFGMPGCTLYVEPQYLCEVYPAQGVVDWRYSIPANQALLGASFYVQAMLIDVAVPNPLSTFPAVMTNALEGVIGH